MSALRYAYLLALVLWLGGLAVAGALVAPSVFGVLQAWDPVQGRMLAGDVFGEVLARLHLLGYAAGALMIVILTVQRLLGPRPVAYGIRAGLVALMLAVMAYSGLVLLPAIDAIQASVDGPINGLAADDARRVRFDALHARSTNLVGAVIAGGLILLLWEAREK
ncbi:MAG: DUF4149 domain-containing protein [Vicinamibacterales bacterium]